MSCALVDVAPIALSDASPPTMVADADTIVGPVRSTALLLRVRRAAAASRTVASEWLPRLLSQQQPWTTFQMAARRVAAAVRSAYRVTSPRVHIGRYIPTVCTARSVPAMCCTQAAAQPIGVRAESALGRLSRLRRPLRTLLYGDGARYSNSVGGSRRLQRDGAHCCRAYLSTSQSFCIPITNLPQPANSASCHSSHASEIRCSACPPPRCAPRRPLLSISTELRGATWWRLIHFIALLSAHDMTNTTQTVHANTLAAATRRSTDTSLTQHAWRLRVGARQSSE